MLQQRRPIGLTLDTATTSNAAGHASRTLTFEDFYERADKKLGKGSFGKVYKAKHKESKTEYAVKIIERKRVSGYSSVEETRKAAEVESMAIQEIAMLEDCRDVKNVVELIDYYVSPERYYIVTTLAAGGDIFQRLRQGVQYSELNARHMGRQLLEVVDALHRKNMCHLDLKPNNILLRNDRFDRNFDILVADFGLSKKVTPGHKFKTPWCGTLNFMAPEIIRASTEPDAASWYDERVDNWSVGCLLYTILCSCSPFDDEVQILHGDYVMYAEKWNEISAEAKNLISELLVVDPDDRLQASAALQHPWFLLPDSMLKCNDLSTTGEDDKFFKKMVKKFITKLSPRNDNVNHHYFLNQEESGNSLVQDLKRASRRRRSSTFHDLYTEGNDLLERNTHEGYEEGDTYKLHECHHRDTEKVFEVKEVFKGEKKHVLMTSRTSAATMMLREAAFLDALDFNHANIIRIHDFFDDGERYYVVGDRIRGPDVYQRLLDSKRYSLDETRLVAHQVLRTVAYFHSKGIVHRNLKPQSLLFASDRCVSTIKISGFGLARRIYKPNSLTNRVGSQAYVSPEVLKNIPYGHAADCWSVGVILYTMLDGHNPFSEDDVDELYRKIRIGDWDFNDATVWDGKSQSAKEVIVGLLTVNPSKRLTAKQALQCPWFSEMEANVDDAGYYCSNNMHSDCNSDASTLSMSSSQSKRRIGCLKK